MREARFVIAAAVLVSLVLILVYVIQKLRGLALETRQVDYTEHLTQFRKMHEEGQLNDQDFRRVKQHISKQVKEKPTPHDSEELEVEQGEGILDDPHEDR